MYCVRNVTEDLYWVGANDHRLTLFENIHPIPDVYKRQGLFNSVINFALLFTVNKISNRVSEISLW